MTKRENLSKLDIVKINDNKKFWKTITPFSSDKGLNCNKMMLSENSQRIYDETTIAETINKQFVNVIKKLKLKPTETERNELALSKILVRMNDENNLLSH